MKRSVFWSAATLFAAWTLPASAQLSDGMVKIGVATDMSSLYSDINGPGAVIATQMAILPRLKLAPRSLMAWGTVIIAAGVCVQIMSLSLGSLLVAHMRKPSTQS